MIAPSSLTRRSCSSAIIASKARNETVLLADQTHSVAWALASEPKRYSHLIGLAARAAAWAALASAGGRKSDRRDRSR